MQVSSYGSLSFNKPRRAFQPPIQPKVRPVKQALQTFHAIPFYPLYFASQPEPATGPRILLLEDDQDTRRAIQQFLSHFGFQVEATHNLATARQWIQAGNTYAHYVLDNHVFDTDPTQPSAKYADKGGETLAMELERQGIQKDRITFISNSPPPGFTNVDKTQLVENIQKKKSGNPNYTLLSRIVGYEQYYKEMVTLYQQDEFKKAQEIYQKLDPYLYFPTDTIGRILCEGEMDVRMNALSRLMTLKALKEQYYSNLNTMDPADRTNARSKIRHGLANQLPVFESNAQLAVAQQPDWIPYLKLNAATAHLQYASLYNTETVHIDAYRQAVQNYTQLLEQNLDDQPELKKIVLQDATTCLHLLKTLEKLIGMKQENQALQQGALPLIISLREQLAKHVPSVPSQNETTLPATDPMNQLEELSGQLHYVEYPATGS